jgi:hypothetical protein
MVMMIIVIVRPLPGLVGIGTFYLSEGRPRESWLGGGADGEHQMNRSYGGEVVGSSDYSHIH